MEWPQKLKIELSNDPVFYRKNKNTNLIDLCAPMYNAALFAIAEVGKHPKCPSAYEWVKTMWLRHTHPTPTPPYIYVVHMKHTHTHIYKHTYTYMQWNITQPQNELNSTICGNVDRPK